MTIETPTLEPRNQIPSVVDMVVDWLRAQTNITTVTGGISSTLPVEEDDIVYPWITVQRIIGATMFPEAPLDRARLQFNVWGGVKSNGAPNWGPADIAVRALEMEIRTTVEVRVPGKGVLRGFQGLEGIQQLQDPDTNGARFWMDAIVVGAPE